MMILTLPATFPDLRGIELTLTGTVVKKQVGGEVKLTMASTSTRPEVILAPFKAADVLERDHKASALMPASDAELNAFTSLSTIASPSADGVRLNVTGRLHKLGENSFELDVRGFEVVDEGGAKSQQQSSPKL
jgi:galactose oxidase